MRTPLAALTLTIAAGAIGLGATACGTSQPNTGPAVNAALVSHCTDLYNHREWATMTHDCYATTTFVDHTPENGQPPTWTGFKATTDMADTELPPSGWTPVLRR